MAAWYRRRSGDIILRMGGATTLCGTWFVGRLLMVSATLHARGTLSLSGLLRDMALFDLACLGMVALILGRHLFDPITLSDRWAVGRRHED